MKPILILEDEVGFRLALSSQLAEFGKILEASNEEVAFDMIDDLRKEERDLGLAVVDLQLPRCDAGIDPDAGFEVIEKLQSTFPETPIIILTIRNDRDAWEQANRYPSVRYFITKPWLDTELQAAAKKCLEASAQGLTLKGTLEGVEDAD